MTYGELIKMPDYHLMCSALGPYTPLIDYVGADGDWKSKYIPRTMWGIDINICAYIHDWESPNVVATIAQYEMLQIRYRTTNTYNIQLI